MRGIEHRKDKKRGNTENIRRAARELFESYGLRRVTINEIARKAGVSPVTIYNYFGTKDKLMRDVVETTLTSIMDKLRKIVQADMAFPDKLEALILHNRDIARQYQGEMIQTLLQGHAGLGDILRSARKEGFELLADLLKQGKREGCLDPKLSKEAWQLYIEIIARGIFAVSGFLGGAIEPDLMRGMTSLVLCGLAGHKKLYQKLK